MKYQMQWYYVVLAEEKAELGLAKKSITKTDKLIMLSLFLVVSLAITKKIMDTSLFWYPLS